MMHAATRICPSPGNVCCRFPDANLLQNLILHYESAVTNCGSRCDIGTMAPLCRGTDGAGATATCRSSERIPGLRTPLADSRRPSLLPTVVFAGVAPGPTVP